MALPIILTPTCLRKLAGSDFIILLLIAFLVTCCHSEKAKKKKDVRDFNDADIERLYEQWEEGDDPLEEDELPEHKRPQPKIDVSQIDPTKPEEVLKLTKKKQTLMMFVSVSGNPSKEETEQITQLWQTSLFNANFELQRFVVDDNRAIFMLKDGSLAFEVRDFLVKQERCAEVTIEQQSYPGRGAAKNGGAKTGKQKNAKPNKNKSEDEL